MEQIITNPYLVFGTCANASDKDIKTNINRIKFQLKVAKRTTFPIDFTEILGSPNRSLINVNKALATISEPYECLFAWMYWLVNITNKDSEAIELAHNNNFDAAIALLKEEHNFSAIINRVVLNYIKNEEYDYLDILKIILNDRLWQDLITSFKSVTTFKEDVDKNKFLNLFLEKVSKKIEDNEFYYSIKSLENITFNNEKLDLTAAINWCKEHLVLNSDNNVSFGKNSTISNSSNGSNFNKSNNVSNNDYKSQVSKDNLLKSSSSENSSTTVKPTSTFGVTSKLANSSADSFFDFGSNNSSSTTTSGVSTSSNSATNYSSFKTEELAPTSKLDNDFAPKTQNFQSAENNKTSSFGSSSYTSNSSFNSSLNSNSNTNNSLKDSFANKSRESSFGSSDIFAQKQSEPKALSLEDLVKKDTDDIAAKYGLKPKASSSNSSNNIQDSSNLYSTDSITKKSKDNFSFSQETEKLKESSFNFNSSNNTNNSDINSLNQTVADRNYVANKYKEDLLAKAKSESEKFSSIIGTSSNNQPSSSAPSSFSEKTKEYTSIYNKQNSKDTKETKDTNNQTTITNITNNSNVYSYGNTTSAVDTASTVTSFEKSEVKGEFKAKDKSEVLNKANIQDRVEVNAKLQKDKEHLATEASKDSNENSTAEKTATAKTEKLNSQKQQTELAPIFTDKDSSSDSKISIKTTIDNSNTVLKSKVETTFEKKTDESSVSENTVKSKPQATAANSNKSEYSEKTFKQSSAEKKHVNAGNSYNSNSYKSSVSYNYNNENNSQSNQKFATINERLKGKKKESYKNSNVDNTISETTHTNTYYQKNNVKDTNVYNTNINNDVKAKGVNAKLESNNVNKDKNNNNNEEITLRTNIKIKPDYSSKTSDNTKAGINSNNNGSHASTYTNINPSSANNTNNNKATNNNSTFVPSFYEIDSDIDDSSNKSRSSYIYSSSSSYNYNSSNNYGATSNTSSNNTFKSANSSNSDFTTDIPQEFFSDTYDVRRKSSKEFETIIANLAKHISYLQQDRQLANNEENKIKLQQEFEEAFEFCRYNLDDITTAQTRSFMALSKNVLILTGDRFFDQREESIAYTTIEKLSVLNTFVNKFNMLCGNFQYEYFNFRFLKEAIPLVPIILEETSDVEYIEKAKQTYTRIAQVVVDSIKKTIDSSVGEYNDLYSNIDQLVALRLLFLSDIDNRYISPNDFLSSTIISDFGFKRGFSQFISLQLRRDIFILHEEILKSIFDKKVKNSNEIARNKHFLAWKYCNYTLYNIKSKMLSNIMREENDKLSEKVEYAKGQGNYDKLKRKN